MKPIRRRSPGFSLLEMILVIALIAAASLLAVAAFGGGMKGIKLRAGAKDVAAQMRFARAVAISSGEPQDVIIDPAARQWQGAKGRSGSLPDVGEVVFTGARASQFQPGERQCGQGRRALFPGRCRDRRPRAHGRQRWRLGRRRGLADRGREGQARAGLAMSRARRIIRSSRRDGIIARTSGRARQRGYTLIEIIVAFAILALGLTLLLGTLSGATRQVRAAGDAGRAALHAQSLLDEFATLPQPQHREGDLEQGRYHWQLDVTPWQDPSPQQAATPADPNAARLLHVRLRVAWAMAAPGHPSKPTRCGWCCHRLMG